MFGKIKNSIRAVPEPCIESINLPILCSDLCKLGYSFVKFYVDQSDWFFKDLVFCYFHGQQNFFKQSCSVSYIDLGYSQSWDEENGQRDVPTSDYWSSDFTRTLHGSGQLIPSSTSWDPSGFWNKDNLA